MPFSLSGKLVVWSLWGFHAVRSLGTLGGSTDICAYDWDEPTRIFRMLRCFQAVSISYIALAIVTAKNIDKVRSCVAAPAVWEPQSRAGYKLIRVPALAGQVRRRLQRRCK